MDCNECVIFKAVNGDEQAFKLFVDSYDANTANFVGIVGDGACTKPSCPCHKQLASFGERVAKAIFKKQHKDDGIDLDAFEASVKAYKASLN